MELLRQGDSQSLERMVMHNPSAVRMLQGRLWDADAEIRRQAAIALGAAAAAHPDLGRELLQSRVSYRYAEVNDALFDLGGILLGWLLAFAGLRRWAAKVESVLTDTKSA